MPSSSTTSLLNVELRPGRPPMLRVDSTDDASRWMAEHRDAGDLMLVDNVRTAHAREAFAGSREVLVAMADAVHLADCSPTIDVTASS